MPDDFLHGGLVEDEDGAPYPEHVQAIVRTLAQEIELARGRLGKVQFPHRIDITVWPHLGTVAAHAHETEGGQDEPTALTAIRPDNSKETNVSDTTTRAKDCFEKAATALDAQNIDLAVGWRELGDAFLRAQDADTRKNLVPA